MTGRTDVERLIATWLAEEATEHAPERVLAGARTRIAQSPQRRVAAGVLRPGGAWTLRSLALAAAVAALLLLAAVFAGGSNLLPTSSPTPLPTSQSPTSSTGASPSVAASPSASLAPLPPFGLHDINTTGLNLDIAREAGGGGSIDIGPDGNLYVLSRAAGAPEVVVLTPDAKLVRRWGQAGTGPGQLRTGWDWSIAVAPDGTVYVGEGSDFYGSASASPRVLAYTSDGRFLRSWGTWGMADGDFKNVLAVDVGPDGSVYVADDANDTIQRFQPDGTFVSVIARRGADPGQVRNTGDVKVGPDGTVYAVDFGNDRIEAWTADGTFLWTLGSSGIGPGQLIQPLDLAIGADGSLYVLDIRRLQVFDAARDPIEEFLGAGEIHEVATEGSHLWLSGGGLSRITLQP